MVLRLAQGDVQIAVVTLRRRLIRTTVYSLGSTRPLCCGMRSHPFLLSLRHYLNVVACLSLTLSAGWFSS